MTTSKMTNEQLASWLDSLPSDDGVILHRVCREAAKRLLTPTIRSDNSAVIAELERRLKVAEDALMECKNAMCNYCRSTPEAKGLPCLNGCETLAIAKNALAEIRGEGGAK